MYIKIRLYKENDYDLLALIHSKQIRFTSVVKESLEYAIYHNKDKRTVEALKTEDLSLPEFKQYSLSIDDEYIEKCLVNVKNKGMQLNSFIKSVVRAYIEYDIANFFLDDLNRNAVTPQNTDKTSSIVKVAKSKRKNDDTLIQKPKEEALSEVNFSADINSNDENFDMMSCLGNMMENY